MSVPLALITKPVNPPLPINVVVTSAGTKAAPFRVSLANTVAVLPPAAPNGLAEKSSLTASMGCVIRTVAMALSQLVGLITSQMR